MKKLQNRILVAPLNWGLGHATRCIPIINELIKHGFIPVIASDGDALELLKKEFPKSQFLKLPGYQIKYSKKGKNLKLKLLKNSPKMLKAISKEKALVKKMINSGDIHGVISDNRLGVYSKQVPSVFITHQLQVMSGSTTWLTTKMHEKIISKFDECWVPDTYLQSNLSGNLGHANTIDKPLKYLGVLSRFTKENRVKKYDLLVLLSGPEPQRTYLEKLILEELKSFEGNTLVVNGVIEKKQKCIEKDNTLIYNFMTSKQLQNAINESEIVLSRSGYTTIMDLAMLEKKAFFIPTPGQFEQEYLAKRLSEQGFVPYCSQEEFTIKKLKMVADYSGLSNYKTQVDYDKLFSLFKRK